MRIVFSPSDKYKTQIIGWLQEEFDNCGEGLYHNFIVEDLSRNNFLCCIDRNGLAVGFVVYSHRTSRATIDLASVKSSEKRNGICRLMLDALEKRLAKRGIVVMELFCSPSSSEKVWIKLGFKRFKERENHRFLNSRDLPHPYLYKSILPSLKPSRSNKLNSYVELWTEFDHIATNTSILPSYRWNVENKKIPIVYPVDRHWKVRYVVNGEEIWSGRMEAFVYSFSDHGNFLIFHCKSLMTR